MFPPHDDVDDDEWTSAYEAGCDAGLAANEGKAVGSCPYKHGALIDAWRLGFDEMTGVIEVPDPLRGFSEF